ncbi:MAG: polysaccharide deacetylase family protein [Lautropia sp.]
MTPAASRVRVSARPARRWRASPAIRASILLHALALPVLGALGVAIATGRAAPGAEALAIGLVAALAVDHLLLTAAGLWPRSRWLGPNLVDLHGTEAGRGRVFLTIDDGPDPLATPAVLDLLAAHGARASFFLVGRKALAQPSLVARIVREGHRVENHSWAHGHGFSLKGMRALERELARAQAELATPDGRCPAWFRAPAGLRNPLLEPVLCRLGLRLASWTRRGFDTRERDASVVLRRLAGGADGSRLRDGDILLLHDGNAARDADGEPVVVPALRALLDACRRRGLAVAALPEPECIATPTGRT